MNGIDGKSTKVKERKDARWKEKRMKVEQLVHGERYYTAFGKGIQQFPILWDAKKHFFLDLTYGERLTVDQVKVIAKFPEMEPLDSTPNTEAKQEDIS